MCNSRPEENKNGIFSLGFKFHSFEKFSGIITHNDLVFTSILLLLCGTISVRMAGGTFKGTISSVRKSPEKDG